MMFGLEPCRESCAFGLHAVRMKMLMGIKTVFNGRDAFKDNKYSKIKDQEASVGSVVGVELAKLDLIKYLER
jgi:hypothetical protein